MPPFPVSHVNEPACTYCNLGPGTGTFKWKAATIILLITPVPFLFWHKNVYCGLRIVHEAFHFNSTDSYLLNQDQNPFHYLTPLKVFLFMLYDHYLTFSCDDHMKMLYIIHVIVTYFFVREHNHNHTKDTTVVSCNLHWIICVHPCKFCLPVLA